MGINLENPYEEIKAHVGHEIACVTYGDGVNVAIECVTCGDVLIDADAPDEDEDDAEKD